MNKRLKQLAEQAGMTDDKFGMFFAKDGHTEDGVDLEKFAELIVRECANLNFRSTGHVTTDGEVAIGEMINKHFGVEE